MSDPKKLTEEKKDGEAIEMVRGVAGVFSEQIDKV